MPESIAITGPESTGKSLLASGLAKNYDGILVPEFARTYLTDLNREYTLQDIVTIAQQQEQLILQAKQANGKIIFADTEILVCYIWADFVFGHVPDEIKSALQRQHFDLYLLCSPDLPWEPDPLREHPHQRQQLFQLYLNKLQQLRWPFAIVSGQDDDRMQSARQAMEAQFG